LIVDQEARKATLLEHEQLHGSVNISMYVT